MLLKSILKRLIILDVPQVFVSQRNVYVGNFYSVIVKPEVKEIKEHDAKFVDGSVEMIDVIVYCTGYFPLQVKIDLG